MKNGELKVGSKNKSIDIEKLNKLTKDYFWSQKREELGWITLGLIVTGLVLDFLCCVGMSFEGYEWACEQVDHDGARNGEFMTACLNNNLNIWGELELGFYIFLNYVIFPLMILAVIGICIYQWINCNLEKATKRATEELINNTKSKKKTKGKV